MAVAEYILGSDRYAIDSDLMSCIAGGACCDSVVPAQHICGSGYFLGITRLQCAMLIAKNAATGNDLVWSVDHWEVVP